VYSVPFADNATENCDPQSICMIPLPESDSILQGNYVQILTTNYYYYY